MKKLDSVQCKVCIDPRSRTDNGKRKKKRSRPSRLCRRLMFYHQFALIILPTRHAHAPIGEQPGYGNVMTKVRDKTHSPTVNTSTFPPFFSCLFKLCMSKYFYIKKNLVHIGNNANYK